jgi:uncharacterized protein YraI
VYWYCLHALRRHIARRSRRKTKESTVMNAKWAARCLVALLALAPLGTFAQEAFTRQPANVRAGPDRDYPLVAQLGPGSPVRVMGCLEDWTWCDVAFDDNRGWVYGPFLLYGVQDDRVPLYTYGPSLGIAIIGFSLGGYWDEHYRQRPWYSGREDWSRRAPPPHRAPSGLPPHAVYTPGVHADRGAQGPATRPHAATPGRPERSGAAPQEHAQEHPAQQAPQHLQASAPQRATEHAPVPRENSKGNSPHEQPAPGREGGGERGGGEKGGGEKSPRENNR